MKPLHIKAILPIVAVLSLPAFAEEKKEVVTLESLPAPVAATIKKAAGPAKIKRIEKEVEDGKTVYEAKANGDATSRTIKVDAEGNLISEEMMIALTDAPKAVQDEITKLTADGKLESLERETEKGKVTYEAVIVTKGKREEVELSPEGKELKREAKEKSAK